jgi:hypothetical protein
VIAAVKELGLKPYQAPEPLPPIELDEVSIVCWMSVSSDKLADDLPASAADHSWS